MVFIFCALYAEAAGIIEKYELKKQNDTGLKFDVFRNESKEIVLTLTGTGMVGAAAAVSSVCTCYGAGIEDRIVNIGICAGRDIPGTVVIANKIVNLPAEKSFYPDMLFKSGLPERTLVSAPRMVTKDCIDSAPAEEIYDMEAAGIFEAAAFYTAQHCISFVKVVSDGGIIGPEQVYIIKDKMKTIYDPALPRITQYIDLLLETQRKDTRADDTEEYLTGLSADMRCSVTMQNRLRQLIRYAQLTGTDYRAVTGALYEAGLLPVKNKNDGKRILDELAKKLI